CMTVHQHTPSSSATPETGRASSPTWRQASMPARQVSSALGGTWTERSVQVLAGHASSRQRQRRLDHTRRAGRPKQVRSRMSTRTRSWHSASTPQLQHPVTEAVVSTAITTSSSPSVTLSTVKPASPSIASARPVPSLMSEVPSSKLSRTTATMSGPLAALVDGRLLHDPQFNAKSHECSGGSRGEASSQVRQEVIHNHRRVYTFHVPTT